MPADCQCPQKRCRGVDVEPQALPRYACPVDTGLRQLLPYDKWAAGCSTGECADTVSATFQSPSPHASKQWHGHAARPVAVHVKYHAGRGLQAQRDCWRRSTQYPDLAARHDAEIHRRESVRERQTARTHSAPCDSDPCRSALAPQGESTLADTVRLLLPASRGEDHGPTTRHVSALRGEPHNHGSVWPHATPAVGTSVPPTWSSGFYLDHRE